MHYLPELATVKELAAGGKYDILPVSCEILSDICTPIEAIKILKNVSTLHPESIMTPDGKKMLANFINADTLHEV